MKGFLKMDILCEDIRDSSSQEKKASSKEHCHSSMKFEAETATATATTAPPTPPKKWLMCQQSDFLL